MENVAVQPTRRTVTMEGVDGTIIRAPEPQFSETRDIVQNYYTEQADSMRAALDSLPLSLRSVGYGTMRVDLKCAVTVVESVLVILSTAQQHLFSCDAKLLATWVGPLIGHFNDIRSNHVPAIIARNIGLAEKSMDMKALLLGMQGLQSRVGDFDRAAAVWRARSPKPEYDQACTVVQTQYISLSDAHRDQLSEELAVLRAQVAQSRQAANTDHERTEHEVREAN